MSLGEETISMRRGMVKVNYVWLVPNFISHHENTGQAIESPEFSPENSPQIRWRLLVYPRGDSPRTEDYVCVRLQLVSVNEMTEIVAKLQISILSSSQDEGSGDIVCSSDMTRFSTCTAWGYDNVRYTLIHRNFLASSPWLTHDTLTIQCRLELVAESLNSNPQDVVSVDASDDLVALFENLIISDVIFSVEGREYPAHKNVLSSQSSFFAAVFNAEIDRKSRTRIEISGVSYRVFFAALRYVYNEELDDMEHVAQDLLPVAKAYGFSALFDTCQRFLQTQLSGENWIHLLILADCHSAHDLKRSVIDKVCSFDTSVINLDEWNNLQTTHPHLIEEILNARREI